MSFTAKLPTRTNYVDEVYKVLLDAISDGSLAPGTRITQEEVAEQLDVSRSPVIQALRQLKTDIGITGGLAQRGVTLAHLPRLVPLAATDFTGGTNPRPATEADYERLFRAAM